MELHICVAERMQRRLVAAFHRAERGEHDLDARLNVVVAMHVSTPPPANLRSTNDYDRIDKVILDALQENARTSYKELAALTGVAPSTCLERVRGLRARGVIAGFRAEVNLARLGVRSEVERVRTAIVYQHLRKHPIAPVDDGRADSS